jgi:HEAT repeat protein
MPDIPSAYELKLIHKISRKLRRTNPLCTQIQMLLASSYPYSRGTARIPAPQMEGISPEYNISMMLEAVGDLSDRNWRERTVAAWALGLTAPQAFRQYEAAQALCTVLDRRTTRSAQRVTARTGRAILRTLLFFSPFVLLGLIAGAMNGWSGGWLALLFFMVFGMGFQLMFAIPAASYAHDEDCTSRGREMAALALGRLRVPESVTSLAVACLDTRLRIKQAAIRAIEQVLPLLTEEHYGRLHAETTPSLCALLSETRHPQSQRRMRPDTLMVLEALGRMGDGRAVPYVEGLAQRDYSPVVRQTAERVLPILRERRRQEEASQILLRASSREGGMDTLLRAAQYSAPTASDQLLRPTSGEDASESAT